MTRNGYTLVEVVVAVMLLAVGVLGLVSATTSVSRLIRWGGAQSAAAGLATARLDAMRAGGCGRLAGGDTVVASRYRVRWEAAAAGPLRPATAVVTYAWGGGVRADTFETAVSCAR